MSLAPRSPSSVLRCKRILYLLTPPYSTTLTAPSSRTSSLCFPNVKRWSRSGFFVARGTFNYAVSHCNHAISPFPCNQPIAIFCCLLWKGPLADIFPLQQMPNGPSGRICQGRMLSPTWCFKKMPLWQASIPIGPCLPWMGITQGGHFASTPRVLSELLEWQGGTGFFKTGGAPKEHLTLPLYGPRKYGKGW